MTVFNQQDALALLCLRKDDTFERLCTMQTANAHGLLLSSLENMRYAGGQFSNGDATQYLLWLLSQLLGPLSNIKIKGEHFHQRALALDVSIHLSLVYMGFFHQFGTTLYNEHHRSSAVGSLR